MRTILFFFTLLPIAASCLAAQGVSPVDSTFGDDGLYLYEGSTDYSGIALDLLDDDRVLVLTEIGGRGQMRLLAVRPDGSGLDRSFDRQGRGHVTYGNRQGGVDFSVEPADVMRTEDGAILVACRLRSVPGSTTGEIAILRLHSDGTIDTTFGEGGFAILRRAREEYANSLALAPDGKIYLSGEFRGCREGGSGDCLRAIVIARFTPDGRLDSTFGGTGFVEEQPDDYLEARSRLLVRPDGSPVVAARGASYFDIEDEYRSRIKVYAYTLEGTRDASFGFGGFRSLNYVETTVFGSRVLFGGVALLPDGRVVVAGSTALTGISGDQADWNMTIWRLTPGGTHDSTLIGPLVSTPDGPTESTRYYGRKALFSQTLPIDEHARSVVPHGSGLWLLGSSSKAGDGRTRSARIARVREDGTPDSSFAGTGTWAFDLPGDAEDEYFIDGTLQSDGGLIALLTVEVDGREKVGLVRIAPGGRSSVRSRGSITPPLDLADE